jgi:formamidase
LLPVFVDGALFSVGDAHFAQGDGEACGTAIEMAGAILVRFTVHKGEAARRGIRFPRLPATTIIFRPSSPPPSASSQRPDCRSARTAPTRAKTRL